ncbi:MAG: Fe-S protein assembly co-chaperone HscB [Bacteroidetes bacterium]|nr:Fe-S protein assembly co-chaperone HscB [Bacteroidota bacterium]
MQLPDFFSFYELQESFHPDPTIVRKCYYAKSREYHPDLMAHADEAQKQEAIALSAWNNQAFQTLNDADATMGYILRLHGVLTTDEGYQLPADFLMEMMELNEALEEQTDTAEQAKAAAIADWEKGVQPLIKRFDEGDQSQALLLQLKDCYFRKKYLNRLTRLGAMD